MAARRTSLLLALVLLALGAAGLSCGACTVAPRTDGAPAGAAGIAGVAPFVAGDPWPTEKTLSARDFLPAEGMEARFEVLRDGTPLARESERVELQGDELVYVRERDGRTEERLHLRRDGDGALRLGSVETPPESMRSLFAEPLPFAPATLTPGIPCEGRSPMEVRTVPQDRLRARGTGSRSLSITGECDVRHHGVARRAVIAEFRFEAALDAARAEVRSELFIVPGMGVIAERRREKRVILGILGSTRDELAVLVETVPAAARAK